MKLDKAEFGPFWGYQSAMEAWLSPSDFIVGDPQMIRIEQI